MGSLLPLLILVLLNLSKLETTLGYTRLNKPIMIATLLPADDRRLFSIKRVRPAIEIAVQKVQAPDGILPGQQIEINYADSKCSAADAMNEAINYFVRNMSHVFFGPVCEYAAAPVGRQTRWWKIPMISCAVARDFAVEKVNKFPMMTRMGGSINKLADFVASIMQEFNWRHLKFIYEPEGQDYISDRLCHVTVESLHFSLIGLLEGVPYSKFETIGEILTSMKDRIGTQNAGRTILCVAKYCPHLSH